MTIPWADIFALILQMIENCPEPEPQSRISALRRPNGLQTLRFERGVRQAMDISPLAWRSKRSAVMAEIYAQRDQATDEDLAELVDQCRAGAA